jgi:hypothetical protein
MNRRAIVHLGLPKCGSSALQLRLAAAAEQLPAHGGFYPIHRPNGARSVSMGHMALAGELAAAKGGESPLLAEYLDRFARSGAHTLILSSESLAARSWVIGEATAAPLNAFEVDLVLFTRRADAHAVSAYKHQVRRQRHTGSFTEFVAESERPRTRRTAMNLPRTLAAAKRLFSEARIHLHDLDAEGRDSIALFGAISGLPLTEWSNEPRPGVRSRNALLQRSGRAVNQSHSDEKTLYQLACNRSALPDEVVTRIDQLLVFVPDAPADPRRLLSAGESRRLLDANRLHNRAVETEFGFPLATHAPMPLPENARTALTAEEADAITDGLAEHLSPEVVEQLHALWR